VKDSQLGKLDDIDLLDRYRGGDLQAFAVLLSRYQTPVYNFVLRSVRDASTAEDLVQDTFTRVVQRADGFQGHARFSTWLYAIARNLCIDHARRMQHRRHPSLDATEKRDGDAGTPLRERVAGTGPGTERLASHPQLRKRIAMAVEGLPPDQRDVFLMRQVQHLPFAQIAEIVGCSENTVKSRMRYALERLQEALADYHDHLEEALG